MRRRQLWTTVLVVSTSMLIASTATGQETSLIDFEAPEAIAFGMPGESFDPFFYAEHGVRFGEGATVVQYPEGFASSGTNGLEMCYQAEDCTTPFTVYFDLPQQSVTVFVGYSGGLDRPDSILRAVNPRPSPTVHMVALDENGEQVATVSATFDETPPIPVGLELSVTDPEDPIAEVEIGWSTSTISMNSLVVDDVRFVPFNGPADVTPELETAPPPGPETSEPGIDLPEEESPGLPEQGSQGEPAATNRPEDLDPDLVFIAILIVAIGGSVLLVKLWRPRPKPPRGSTPRKLTVLVKPDPGSPQVTTDDRLPLSAIHVVSSGHATTTISEEEPL